MRKIFVLFFSIFILFSGCESSDHTHGGGEAVFEEAHVWRKESPEEKMLSIKNNKALEGVRISNPESYVNRVAWEINSSAKDDFEKVKMVHDITILVLKYDVESFQKDNIPPQGYMDVLKTGLAVSAGYANVFKKFCDQLKIPCEKVDGYARIVGDEPVDEENHAWNIVKINSAWYFVDCAWDAGYVDGRETVQSYGTDWLFMRPEHFIYTHLPSNQHNQLIFPRISLEQFYNFPKLRINFFDSVNAIPANLKKINYCEETFIFPLDTKVGYNITFTVENISESSELLDCYSAKTSDGRKYATFTFPKAGKYFVKMFSWKDGAQVGEYCGEFSVDVSRGSNDG